MDNREEYLNELVGAWRTHELRLDRLRLKLQARVKEAATNFAATEEIIAITDDFADVYSLLLSDVTRLSTYFSYRAALVKDVGDAD